MGSVRFEARFCNAAAADASLLLLATLADSLFVAYFAYRY